MIYVLDTHTWIWLNAAPENLGKKARKLLEKPGEADEFLLPAIAVWELCKLVQKGRVVIGGTVEEWIAAAFTMPQLRLAPLTPKVALEANALPGEFHQDPADQMIVATARVEGGIVITRDERIREYQHVKSIW